jgi:hypothetical protein
MCYNQEETTIYSWRLDQQINEWLSYAKPTKLAEKTCGNCFAGQSWDSPTRLAFEDTHYPLVNVYITMERSTIFNG